MNKAMRIFGAIVPALLAVCFSMSALAAPPVVNVTAATGGSAISNSNIASGVWTALTGPVLSETAPNGIAVGSIILTAPTGFMFNTAAPVTVTVGLISGTASKNLTLASSSAVVTASTITITVATSSSGTTLGSLTWSGIQVIPTGCTPLATGNIILSGTSAPNLSSTNLGTLTETGSAALTYIQQPSNALINTMIAPAITLNACGSGAALPTVTVALTTPAGATLSGTLSATTSNTTGLATFSNLAVNLAGTYTLTATSPGLTSGVSSSFIIYNPAPITTSISPFSANAGAAGFIMTVNGTNFVTTSVVYFAGTALTTTYVSATQLTATVPAGLLTTAGTYNITVVNPAISGVGGGTSNAQVFTVITVISPVSSFNAFDWTTAAGATTGYIMTKISSTAFALDVVALTSAPAVFTGFTGTVQVELVDGNNGASCATYANIQTLATNPIFGASDNGRHQIASITEPNAWKNVYVRISYPPTNVSCSSDAFAIRPKSFAILVQDLNRTMAGTTNTLTATAVAGTPVHNAGQPFTVQATAQNASAVTTTNYTGKPGTVLSACAGTACTTLATFSIGTWPAAVAGVNISTTATYSEVGAFTLQLQDKAFASVDAAANFGAGDGTKADCTGQWVCSSVDVGRFVPDHFAVSVGSSLVNRSDICSLGCGTFTYMGEQMNAVFTLTAMNGAAIPAITQNYTYTSTNNLAKLIPTAAVTPYTSGPLGLGVIDTSATRTPFAVCTATPAHPCFTPSVASSGSFASGVATNITVPLTVYRGATAVGPFAALNVGIAPVDSDGVTTIYNLDTVNVVAGASNHTNLSVTGDLLYGRIKLANAYGSELLSLPITATVQYWNSASYVTSITDSATQFNTKLTTAGGDVQAVIVKGPLALANVSVVTPGLVAFTNGVNTFKLTAPNVAGSADLTIITAPSYLLPSTNGRATFGVYKGANGFIYLRENY